MPDAPHRFPLRLRIPAWTTGASLTVNGKPHTQPLTAGTFALIERTWTGGDVLELRLPMQPVVTRWFNNSVAISRGPLVFSLDPGESWMKLRERGPTADWQVFPQQAWNYALRVDEATAPAIQVLETPVPARPFAAENTPVRLHVPARRLNSWRSEDGVAAPIPKGKQRSAEPEEILTLIPYAAAKLRVTAFPELET